MFALCEKAPRRDRTGPRGDESRAPQGRARDTSLQRAERIAKGGSEDQPLPCWLASPAHVPAATQVADRMGMGREC
jgi:hypothetical protein